MIVESGELQTRASFEKRSKKENAIGETLDTWKPIGTFLVKYSLLSNKSMELAKGFSASIDKGILMRFVGQIDNDCRVIIEGKTIQIGGVIHDPKKQWTQIFLSEQVN